MTTDSVEERRNRKRICHFISVHKWDDIRVFQKECVSLAKSGYDVYVVAKGAEDTEVNGVKVVGVDDVGGGRIKRILYQSKRVYQKAKELDCDVYHFHDPELLKYGLRLKCAGKKVIYDSHEDLPAQIMGKYWIPAFLRKSVSLYMDRLEKRVAKKIDGVIAATPWIAGLFRESNRNVIAINNYPILEEFSNVDTTNRRGNNICFVGAITEIRGVRQLVEAMHQVNGTLHLAGRFAPASLEEEFKRINGWEKVNYYGEVDRKTVGEILGKCAIGVVTYLPNPNHVKAQPNKMFEYLVAGQALVASDFEVWKEFVEPGGFGVCTDPNDPGAIAAVLNSMIENKERTKGMGERGRSAVQASYSWESESKKLIAFYDQISGIR